MIIIAIIKTMIDRIVILRNTANTIIGITIIPITDINHLLRLQQSQQNRQEKQGQPRQRHHEHSFIQAPHMPVGEARHAFKTLDRDTTFGSTP